MSSVRIILSVTALGLLVGGLPAKSSAQPYDHLECYKLRVSKKHWTVDLGHATQPLTLTPFEPPFTPDPGCTLSPKRRPRPRQLCVPVDKSPSQPPAGQDLSNLYACYEMRCPKTADLDLAFTTQFGTGSREVSRNTVRRKLCVPTQIGAVPTATPPVATPTPTVQPPTPTSDPTSSPSPAPTASPTPVQTPTPTVQPPTPTSDPTPSPSPAPTASPSPQPSASPSPTPPACQLECQNGGTLDEENCACLCYPNLTGTQCQDYDCFGGNIDPFFCSGLDPQAGDCSEAFPDNRGLCPQTCLCQP